MTRWQVKTVGTGVAELHGLTLQQPFDKVAVVRCPLGTGSVIGEGSQSPITRLTEEGPRMRTAGIYTDLQQNACHLYTWSDNASHRFI